MYVVSELFGPPRRWVLPPSLVDQCRRFGHAQGEAYSRRTQGGSKWVSGENTSIACMDARIAECIFCVEVGYDPDLSLDWGVSQKKDEGWDVIWRGQKIDVKRTDFNGRFLIWPLTKRREYETAIFDYLVLVKNEAAEGEVWGYISKNEFTRRRRTATPEHRLKAGTWYLDDGWLDPIDDMPYRPPFEAEFMAELFPKRDR